MGGFESTLRRYDNDIQKNFLEAIDNASKINNEKIITTLNTAHLDFINKVKLDHIGVNYLSPLIHDLRKEPLPLKEITTGEMLDGEVEKREKYHQEIIETTIKTIKRISALIIKYDEILYGL